LLRQPVRACVFKLGATVSEVAHITEVAGAVFEVPAKHGLVLGSASRWPRHSVIAHANVSATAATFAAATITAAAAAAAYFFASAGDTDAKTTSAAAFARSVPLAPASKAPIDISVQVAAPFTVPASVRLRP
jgi:hypothetical protein